MNPNELVLVIERSVFDRLGAFHGLMFDVDRYLPTLFSQSVPRFIPRGQAETDPNFKQIIPYVIMSHQGRCLTYVRGKRAGETRLTGLRSIGVGGHINPIDNMPLFSDFFETYRTAVEREVNEEISLDAPHRDAVVALLNDDSNDVGKVHLGVVHHWSLDAPHVSKVEQMITQLEFLTLEELRQVRDEMETWSGLCLDRIDEILTIHPGCGGVPCLSD
jgi:predicted NUDIX family phosphoesterase